MSKANRSKDSNIINVGIRLLSIEEIATFIHNPRTKEELSPETYKVNLSARIALSTKSNTITIIMEFNLKDKSDLDNSPTASNKDKLPSMTYEGSMTYYIEGLELKPNEGTKSFYAPPQIINRLADISYSTFRGIIFNKCGNTPLSKIPIPIIREDQLGTVMRTGNTAEKESKSI